MIKKICVIIYVALLSGCEFEGEDNEQLSYIKDQYKECLRMMNHLY